MLKAAILPALALASGLWLFVPTAEADPAPDGRALWERVEGLNGKSCASCHTPIEESLRGRAATYPKFVANAGHEITLEQRINRCREKVLGAEPWPADSAELQAVATLLRSLN